MPEITEIAASARARTPKQASVTQADPYRAFDLLTEPVECEHGGTVVFASRKSTGVETLVFVPPSGRKSAGVPFTAILDAGFHALTSDEVTALDAYRAERDATPEPEEKPKRNARK